MKNHAYWLGFIFMVLMPACSRRNTQHPARIKTVFSKVMGYTSTYTYAEDGRLLSIITSGNITTSYQYKGNTIAGKTTDPNGRVLSSSLCFLNRSGQADSMANMDATHIISTQKFTYDDEGFVIQEKKYEAGALSTVIKKVVDKGNIVSFTALHLSPYVAGVKPNPGSRKSDSVTVTLTGKEYTVYTDYYSDKAKTLTYENYGSSQFGKGSKNLERTTVQISAEGDTVDITSYQYTFDKCHRVATCITHNQTGELSDSILVTYY